MNPYDYLKEKDIIDKPLSYTKEFCPLLNLEPKQGKAKNLQLNKIMQYCEIENVDRKLIIRRIYNEDEIKMIENKGKFLTHIENFLVLLLWKESQNGNSSTILTNRNIMEMGSIVNPKYFKGMSTMYEYIDLFDVNINEKDIPVGQTKQIYEMSRIYDESHIFFSASYRLLKRMVNDCLDKMEKSLLILKNKTFVCYKTYKDGKYWHSETYLCDDDMIKRILKVQYNSVEEFNQAMKEVHPNCYSKYTIKDPNITYFLPYEKRKILKSIIKHHFTEEFKKEGFTGYSKAWELKLNDSVIFEKEIKNRRFDWKTLNKNVIDKLERAKDLQGINLKSDFIRVFIQNNAKLENRKIAETAIRYIENTDNIRETE